MFQTTQPVLYPMISPHHIPMISPSPSPRGRSRRNLGWWRQRAHPVYDAEKNEELQELSEIAIDTSRKLDFNSFNYPTVGLNMKNIGIEPSNMWILTILTIKKGHCAIRSWGYQKCRLWWWFHLKNVGTTNLSQSQNGAVSWTWIPGPGAQDRKGQSTWINMFKVTMFTRGFYSWKKGSLFIAGCGLVPA